MNLESPAQTPMCAGGPNLRAHSGWSAIAGLASLVVVVALALTGCEVLTRTPQASTAGVTLTGSLHGGQQPIAGALVSLIAPGTTGYGSAGSVLATATTNASGGFTLPAYTCPANSGLVYLFASGGNAGGGINPLIGEAAIVGSCSALPGAAFINISEVTTVAAAYALAPFAAVSPGVTAIGTSATNLQGLANAAGAANNLASTATGRSHQAGEFPGIYVPNLEINTLADILASCVNQGAATGLTGTCATLFSDTTVAGVAPTDTFQAALNIALHPGANTAALYQLIASSVPYQPTLGSAPADFSVALGFNGGAITSGSGTYGIAIDASGDAWMVTGTSGSGVHVLTEISPAGVYLSGSTVAGTTGFGSALLNGPIDLAFDQSGSLYVVNNGGGNLLKFNLDGSLKSTISATSFNSPNAVAIDGLGDPWVANFGGTNVTKIATTGLEASNSPFTAGFGGVDIAVGPLAVWQTNYGNSSSHSVFRIDLTTYAVTSVQIGGSIGGVALDHGNNAWLAVTGNGSVFEITNAGGYASTPNGGYKTSGTFAQNIAVDGLGNVWVGCVTTGTSPGSLLEYSNAATLLSPSAGFTASNVIPPGPGVPGGIAIDGSGNVWVSGTNLGTGIPPYVAEVIGVAAPVVTPRATATTNNTLGVRP